MKGDKAFVRDIKRSELSVQRVLREIRSMGYKAHAPETVISPTYETRWDYVDDGDIHMEDGRIVQVKHSRTDFTWSWPYKDMIVDEWYKAFKYVPEVEYIIVNPPMTHYIVVRGSTHEMWKHKKMFDRTYQAEREFAMAPKSILNHYQFSD